jgi:hypothetical protein
MKGLPQNPIAGAVSEFERITCRISRGALNPANAVGCMRM